MAGTGGVALASRSPALAWGPAVPSRVGLHEQGFS